MKMSPYMRNLINQAAESLFEDFGFDAPENAASDKANSYVNGFGVRRSDKEIFAEEVWERYNNIVNQKERR